MQPTRGLRRRLGWWWGLVSYLLGVLLYLVMMIDIIVTSTWPQFGLVGLLVAAVPVAQGSTGIPLQAGRRPLAVAIFAALLCAFAVGGITYRIPVLGANWLMYILLLLAGGVVGIGTLTGGYRVGAWSQTRRHNKKPEGLEGIETNGA